jgi:hypothetical protein
MRIDELRNTLDQDTSDALQGSSHASAIRLGAVHARVARVRRRRRATALGATVAAVAAVATLVVPPLVHDAAPQPAGHAPTVLAGRHVPTTQTATGFGYHYVQGIQSRPGQQALRLDVKVGDRPRLVKWASSGDSGTLSLARDQDQHHPEISTAGGFDRYAYLGAGQYTEHLRLTRTGGRPGSRLALAVYDLDERPADGVSDGTITYRRQVLDTRLVAAHIGKPGQNDVRLTFRMPSTDVTWADTCYGADGAYEISVSGHALFGTDCQRQPAVDPGATGATFSGTPLTGVRPGDLVHARITFVDQAHTGYLVRDPHVVLALGIYENRVGTERVAGVPLPVSRESQGHAYLSGESFETTPGARVLRVDFDPSDKPRLLTWVASGVAADNNQLVLSQVVSGRTEALDRLDSNSTSDRVQSSGFVIQPGQHPSIRVTVPVGSRPSTRIGLQVSELVH